MLQQLNDMSGRSLVCIKLLPSILGMCHELENEGSMGWREEVSFTH